MLDTEPGSASQSRSGPSGSAPATAKVGSPHPPALGRFVFVMGAGVISLSLEANGVGALSMVFLVVAGLGYLELLIGEGRWALLSPRSLRDSLTEVRAGLGAMTFGVATLVLAARFTVLGIDWLGEILFCIGGVVAVILAYLIPTLLVSGSFVPNRWRLGSGLWLLWPVSLEAVGVAASTLSISAHFESASLAIVAFALWGLGLALYLPILVALLGGLFVTDITLRDLGPSYWVTMGAAALSALGAALIAEDPATLRQLGSAVHLLAPATGLMLWFLATALLPLVVGISLVRTLHRDHLVGAPKELWVAVFPSAMYGLASHTLGVATGSPWLLQLGRVTVWFGVLVFLIELGRGVLQRLLPMD